MKISRKNVLLTCLAVLLAAVTLVGGGTYAYLVSRTGNTVNEFETNQVAVTLSETTGEAYRILPGTTQPKDPTVTVVNTVDAYVFVEVADATDGLVGYQIADGWKKLAGYDGVYYREVAKDGADKAFPVLKDNQVSYDAALENSDMLDESGKLKEGITLTFHAAAIQKEPFDGPKDAYEELQPVNSTLTVGLTYAQKGDPNAADPDFFAKMFETSESKLFQVGALKPFSSDDTWADRVYTFTVSGSSDRDMALTFDFTEKCGENGSYKGQSFADGFGGLGDTFLSAGTYTAAEAGNDFTLVGDYYPVTVTVRPAEGNQIDFSYTGSLTGLAEALSAEPYLLKANTEYRESFTVTMEWLWETPASETCYVLQSGVKQQFMDLADSAIGFYDFANDRFPLLESGKADGSLWADFEVLIRRARKTS